MTPWPPALALFGHTCMAALLLLVSLLCSNSADSSSLFSTHLAYNCHQQLTLTSVHESYDNMPLEHPSANSHVHLTHQICGGFQDKAVTKYSTAA